MVCSLTALKLLKENQVWFQKNEHLNTSPVSDIGWVI